ncbi:MAG: folate family ECF transporter S component [Oscillospiraceae bacterium]|jgi:ECF transporter S component (folate family)|nr:folate family ECF transporter S component [Oscillospiraceae bacterium]
MPIFRTPFSRGYWQAAARSLKDIRMLVLAALLVALRVAVKSLSIPVGESLYITIGFLPNALGSLVYGPYLALLSGAASDILGWMISPKGPFFPAFTLVEMLGSFFFALFLYRAPLTPRGLAARAALAKLYVNLILNILLTPIFLSWMYGKGVLVYIVPRITKNLILWVPESLLLAAVLGAALPSLRRFGLIAAKPPECSK